MKRSYFAKNLIALRTASGMTQTEVAEKLGKKLPSYQSWEYDLAFPPEKQLVAICDLFNDRRLYDMLTKRLVIKKPKKAKISVPELTNVPS